MEGFGLETVLWWRIDFDDDTRNLLRAHVKGRDDLPINVLEPLAMIVTAWASTVDAKIASQYVVESLSLIHI